jgi:hypothetical protein
VAWPLGLAAVTGERSRRGCRREERVGVRRSPSTASTAELGHGRRGGAQVVSRIGALDGGRNTAAQRAPAWGLGECERGWFQAWRGGAGVG